MSFANEIIEKKSSLFLGVKKFFPSGVNQNKEIDDIAKMILTKPEDITLLNNFIISGGKFKKSKGINLYDHEKHEILIDKEYIDTFDLNIVKDVLLHELQHSNDIAKIEKKHPNIRKFESNYDMNSVEIITQSLEISGYFKNFKDGFEQGLPLSQNDAFGKSTEMMYKFLNKHGIKEGNQIPEEYLSPVANLAVLAFSYNLDVNNTNSLRCGSIGSIYQENMLGRMGFLKVILKPAGKGKEKISCREFFEIIDFPCTLSEKVLESLILYRKNNEYKSGVYSRVGEEITTSKVNEKNENNWIKAVKNKIENDFKVVK